MNREQRILDHTTRDATMIVSRKPSNTEGNNGDFAVGNTAQGPMLFTKVKNKWYGFKPRTSTANRVSTFKGSIYLKNFFINTTDPTDGVVNDQGWILLFESSPLMNRHAEGQFQSSWNTSIVNGWKDMNDIPYFLPEDCTIKFIYSVPSIDSSEGGTFVPGSTSTLYIFSLESGMVSWDSDETNIALDSPTLVDTTTATMKVNHTLFEYEINTKKVYPKGSHIAFYIKNVNPDDSEPEHIKQRFILQFEPQEQNI